MKKEKFLNQWQVCIMKQMQPVMLIEEILEMVEEQKEENILELKILGNYGINTVM